MRQLFTIRNDVLWLDEHDQIQMGICAALTATWMKATLDNHGPLRLKGQLTRADSLCGLENFYMRCAMTQARFRNASAIPQELKRKLIMYRQVGLPLPNKADIKISHLMGNILFLKERNGVYSLDIKGPSIWHTMGVYVDQEASYYQLFEPEHGLYESNDRPEFLAGIRDWAGEAEGVSDARDLPCIRYEVK